jgi:DNA-binding IclR family transcriptional regulator
VERQPAVASAERALAMLRLYGPADELRVSDFGRALKVHRSTASRLAATLEAGGFLARIDGRDGYRLGPELARLGVVALGGHGWAEVARPALEALAAASGETAVLSVAAGDEALDVMQATGSHRVAAGSWVGRRTPLHATSDGKVLLAFGAARLPERAALTAVAAGTITDRGRLERELAGVREAGFACALGEAEEGLNGVAVPVTDAAGRCVAALSASGPGYRVPPARLPALAEQCRTAVAEIRARLGWDDPGRAVA